jgi:HK97 family phage prohead protease
MNRTIRADPAAQTLAIDSQKRTIRSVITTIQPDRVGDVIIPTGLRNAEDYLLNPIVLWAHSRQTLPPLGICDWLDIQPHRIVAQTRFAKDVPFAEDVFRLYEQGILRGWSIGFVPRKAVRTASGLRVQEWDLLEYSAVPIPANPEAVTIAIQKGLIQDDQFREWLILRGHNSTEFRRQDSFEKLIAKPEFSHSE